MSDESKPVGGVSAQEEADEDLDTDAEGRAGGGLSDLVRRAVSAGVGAASKGKEDILRVAAQEVKGWLDRLELNDEIVRALSKMVIEVNTQIRFRTTEEGKVVTETVNEVKARQETKSS